jgi:6-phosphogluconolactonase (cycloisomerase 2 family)
MSGTISRYRIARDGTLTLVEAVAGNTGGAPIDMALSREGQFLYTVVDVTGAVSAFRVEDDGDLIPVRGARGLPPFAQGIAAW